MRTNIDIDESLMKQAMKASTLQSKTKKAVVEEALRYMVQAHARRGILKLRGKVQWQGDLDESRLDRELPRVRGKRQVA